MKNQIAVALFCIFGFIQLQNVQGGFDIADVLMGGAFTEIIESINDTNHQLEHFLREVEIRKTEINSHKKEIISKLSVMPKKCRDEHLEHHFTVLTSWSFDSCVDLTDSLQNVSDTILQGSQTIWNITKTAGSIGNEILNCKLEWNPLNTVKCYNNNLQALKTLVYDCKNMIMPALQTWKEMLNEIKLDFLSCIGIPTKSKLFIDQRLENC